MTVKANNTCNHVYILPNGVSYDYHGWAINTEEPDTRREPIKLTDVRLYAKGGKKESTENSRKVIELAKKIGIQLTHPIINNIKSKNNGKENKTRIKLPPKHEMDAIVREYPDIALVFTDASDSGSCWPHFLSHGNFEIYSKDNPSDSPGRKHEGWCTIMCK